MKGFHHLQGSQVFFLNRLALLHNLVPTSGVLSNCGIQVEGAKLPTLDWFLNIPILLNTRILTAGGFM